MRIIARTVLAVVFLVIIVTWAALVGPETLYRMAPYLFVGALTLLIGAGFGYATGWQDGHDAPRYRRTPSPSDEEIDEAADETFPATPFAPENDQRAEDFIAGARYVRDGVARLE